MHAGLVEGVIQLAAAVRAPQHRDPQSVTCFQPRILFDVHRTPVDAGPVQHPDYLVAQVAFGPCVQDQRFGGFHGSILTGYNLDSKIAPFG